MARSFFLTSALFALRAVAQTSTAFTDEKTGIKFQGIVGDTGYRLGYAIPETPTTDFIAQIQAPITNGGGWAGLSMGQSMTSNVLVVAWPNEGKVLSSFRQIDGYTSPPVVTGNFSMKTIPDGTFVTDKAFSYTFLCSNCLSDDSSLGLVISETLNVMGWAWSDKALTDSTSASAGLNYHDAGFGAFGLKMSDAKSADFAKWAALAVGDAPSGGAPSGGNSTAPAPGGNSTAPAPLPSTPISGNSTAVVANETFDYIVAGGGAAGIIAAQRFAESGASVLLIERGGPSYAFTGDVKTLSWNSSVSMYDVPAYGYYLSDVGSPAYCTDTADMAGCLLGGGTAVNAMMYVKPQERDFDDKWPTGWKWADVSAAAERLYERNPGQTYGSQDGVRYDDGAFTVLSKFFASQGWKQTDFIKNPNNKVDVFGHPTWNIANGMRSGSVRTYLPLAKKLDNFKLIMNTNVIRAVREGSAVSGVEVQTADGKRVIYNVKAGGRVVLSAGAMSTPRILFNSGIGPAAQLKTVATGTTGVKLPAEADWIDLPVGAEIKDHPIFTVKFKTSSPLVATDKKALISPNQTTIDLFAKGSGMLAESGQRLNWWSSVKTSDGSEVFFQGTCNSPEDNTVQMKVYITHGLKSVGSLGINAAGATTFITKPHMTSKVDTEAITLMMDRLINMSKSSNSTLSLIAPAGVTNVTSADLIKSFKSGSHYVGTAKIGTKGEPGVVVDTNTKVYGTDNLFVVDASIHPDLPTGNTQAIIMVAAEAAAARIMKLSGTTPSTPVTPGSGNSTTPVPETPASPVVPSALPTSAPVELPEATPSATPSAPVASAPVASAPAATPSPVESATPIPTAPSKPSNPATPSKPAGAPKPSKPAEAPKPSSPAAGAPGGGTAGKWERCGGIGHTGPTACSDGWKCVKQNDYYSQCLSG
ncbi:carbohydrate-binding module family 1 protein [Bipolaris oryzae ATCC 44560]|uniref:Carbohydrate-binding module family 1 protein n=1 Tax=Bipolaris oryzae ATCC 44560 TaxID=930090 RepID=W6ZG50_COCMI|nr:carbohydrate-binding module family 1 protein [Bipolaris oryzae ATCC 44560]EUC46489.1 carbohydrate-binding module family 1 protein [Bipolaris oryzae ATCC 44560]